MSEYKHDDNCDHCKLADRIAALGAERDQLREELASIIDEALLDGGFPESTPNAAVAFVKGGC